MKTKTPTQAKTPFAIDPKPMTGATSARAGLSAVSRVVRSLGLPGQCAANVPIRKRQRGFNSGHQVESLILLHAAGGDCMDDMELLRQDEGLTKMLGYQVPGPGCVGDFIELFHDPERIKRAEAEAQRQQRLAFIPEETALLEGLRSVLRGNVHAIARHHPKWTVSTIDQDATIIESHKRTAKMTYEGVPGYQPMLAVWAEADLILADEFRDGNVPAQMSPLDCAKAAYRALPAQVTEFYYRGDSACHENDLLAWLRDEDRADGPKGPIGFAVSARTSVDLAAALRAVKEKHWTTYGQDVDGTLRQWVDVDFVPGEKSEHKNTKPLRYIGLRLVKPQGELFADGCARHFHAVISNREGSGGDLLNWHREKSGTVEHVHDELKNGLGGGQLPSAKFGANAAWLRIACLAFNCISALRQEWPDESVRTAKAKRLRFAIFNVTGRVSRDRRKLQLRVAASPEWIRSLIKLFALFPLLTQPTG